LLPGRRRALGQHHRAEPGQVAERGADAAVEHSGAGGIHRDDRVVFRAEAAPVCPVSSDMNGPTMVPFRVSTASTATERLLIRFITLTSWPATSFWCRFQSASDEMKNVVLPESPYGV
jgi:hypothetical protein